MHIDAVHDHRDGQARFRITVTNEGAPAFDVKVMGTEGPYGFYGLIPPTGFWRTGEQRSFVVSMPPGPHAEQTQLLVTARDASRQQLHAVTAWGQTYRWRTRIRKMSDERVWRRAYGKQPGPLEVAQTPMHMESIERSTP